MKKKHSMLALLVVCLCCSSILEAANFYWVGASNDWWNAASYSSVKGGTGGTQMPGADDRVVLSANQRVYADDSTIAFFSTIKEVEISGTNIVANFNITTNADLGCYFSSMALSVPGDAFFVKMGPGRLTFAKRGDPDLHRVNGKIDTYHYTMNIDLCEGELALEPCIKDSYRHRYGNVTVREGATLYGVEGGITWFESLAGSGTVTNSVTTGSQLYVVGARNEPTVFSGVLGGFNYFIPQGNTWYTGTQNTIGSIIRPAGYTGTSNVGITGFMTFAGPSSCPSSLGIGNIDGRYSARLLYLGTTGETIERSVTLWNTASAPFVWDAGAYGGLEFTGTFTATGAIGAQQRLVLTGSNTVPCVVRSKFVRNASFGASGSLFHITKQGSGTWRFAEPDETELSGVIGVEEGVLEFDTLREAGLKSALGSATELYADQCLAVTNGLTAVPYAHFLGGDGTTGTLRYLGDVSRTIKRRLVALKGDGRIEAPFAPALNWVGVTSLGDGVKTLTVDCKEWQTNRYANITGNVSVRKSGAGDLVLSGDLSFNGDIISSGGGTLTVKDISGCKYEYYRLALKETAYTSTNEEFSAYGVVNTSNSAGTKTRTVILNEFGLYDAAGKRVNMGDANSGAENVSQLGHGQISLESQDSYIIAAKNETVIYSPWRLLDNDCSGGYRFSVLWSDVNKVPRFDDPHSWVSLVYRMKQGANDAAYFDLNYQVGAGDTNFGQNPTAFSLYASADGLNYEELYSSNNCVTASFPQHSYAWLSDGSSAWAEMSSTKPEKVSHAKIRLPRSTVQTSYNVLGNVRSISADADSTLCYEGEGSLEISGLTADVSGVGIIKGFSFAVNGTLYLTGVSADSTVVDIPANLSGVENLSNAKSWELSINGGDGARYSIASVT
ncbi:MAG: hypothetical protein IKK82_02185, partial [Kiritimatiellae bacterium]|nr:hypothetical protein [Kiritimatiellia bacterium]